VNGHLAEVNNGIAKELYLSKEYITIYGKDNKAWFKIDYSKRRYKEAETVHPRDFKRDAHIVFGKYLNDWRDNEPMTNSEVQQAIGEVTKNQLLFAKNIELHMNVLQDMKLTLSDIRDALKKPVIEYYESKNLFKIKNAITDLEGVFNAETVRRISYLSQEEKEKLSDWLFERFKA
jgi:hypothetical protein